MAALIRHGDELLLVEHRKEGRRYHLLPGGGLAAGETLAEALVREVREECGLTVSVGAPLFLSDSVAPDGSRHVVNIVFGADVLGPAAPARDPRVAGCRWVSVENLGAVRLHPPMASAITDGWADGFSGPARYLGALWADDEKAMAPADEDAGAATT